jgi:hypothetical protein
MNLIHALAMLSLGRRAQPRPLRREDSRYFAGVGGQASPRAKSWEKWHTDEMAKIFFRIMPGEDGGHAVEVTEPGDPAYTVGGFGTEADAEAWVADRQFASKGADRWERLPDGERRY